MFLVACVTVWLHVLLAWVVHMILTSHIYLWTVLLSSVRTFFLTSVLPWFYLPSFLLFLISGSHSFILNLSKTTTTCSLEKWYEEEFSWLSKLIIGYPGEDWGKTVHLYITHHSSEAWDVSSWALQLHQTTARRWSCVLVSFPVQMKYTPSVCFHAHKKTD